LIFKELVGLCGGGPKELFMKQLISLWNDTRHHSREH